MYSDRDLIFIAPEESLLSRAEGGYARRILILVRTDESAENGRFFLQKVLAAAQLSLERDVLLAEWPENKAFSMASVFNKQPEFVFVFGFSPRECGLEIEWPMYEPLVFRNIQFLFADSLKMLEPDKNRKGRLWSILKMWFLPE